MKRHGWILLAVMSLSLAVIGCGKKGEVDTSKLENSFKSAPPAQQSDVDKAVSAVKAGNYSEAVTDLQRLASKAKLTPEQQQAVKDTIAAIQKQMTATASKAAGDLQKSLPK
jgi:outer membrane protein assembly factor BamD (BamD/ComL family)